jgi:hypothetical protein
MELMIRGLIAILYAFGTGIATWITTVVARRRMRRALGRRVTDSELTSISSWMKAVESEQRTGQSRPIDRK